MKYWKKIPPLKSLLALEALSRHRSFSRAADELNVSQSAVSHSILTAESFLGVALVDRTSRPVSLTGAGQAYVATVSRCFRDLVAEAEALQRQKPKNTLTISCNLAVGNYWFLPRLKEFHALHPDLQVNMVTTYQGLASLDDGIDVAIRFGSGNWASASSLHMFDERIIPVASPEYLERNPPIKEPKDLLQHTLLHALSVERSWFDWQQWFEHFGVEIPKTLPGPTFDNHLMMVQYALSGRGIALGWLGTTSDFVRQGQLVEAFDTPVVLQEGQYAAFRDEPDQRVEKFLDWLKDLLERD